MNSCKLQTKNSLTNCSQFSKTECTCDILKYNPISKLLFKCIKFTKYEPNNEIIPHTVHITRHIPTLPEYLNAAVGDTKIPDPIITPTMIFTADNRPIFLCKPTLDFSSLIAAAWTSKSYNSSQ